MTEIELNNSFTILNELILYHSEVLNSFLKHAETILDEFAQVKNDIINNHWVSNDKILSSFEIETKRIQSENKKSSFLFNSLKFFNIGETQHSFLLGKLLDPNSEHGQGNLFLNLFLFRIGIAFSETDIWNVTAEKGRIDILIKRKYPAEAVVVIENKSNYAIDQKNQLYRYWLQEMFHPNDDEPYTYTLDKKDSYRLIYLAPNKNKQIESHSLIKPKEIINPKLPENIEDKHIQFLSFDKDIIGWLEDCVVNLKENHRLREYILQYIELWKN